MKWFRNNINIINLKKAVINNTNLNVVIEKVIENPNITFWDIKKKLELKESNQSIPT